MSKYTHFKWTTEHLRWITANLHLTDEQMAAHIGTNMTRVRAFRKRAGLFKPSCGRFQPGLVPHNKGKVAPWSTSQACARGHFRKGGAPHNTRPIGERWQRKESGYTYWMIKTEKGIEYLHRHVWEQANGPIPPKHKVQFKDGDCGNVALENLRLVSMAQAMREASAVLAPKERARRVWRTRRLNIAKAASKPYNIAA